mgnify:FL=1
MLGAFADITAANLATDNNALSRMNIPNQEKLILSTNRNILN